MKRIVYFSLLVLSTIFIFSSCQKNEDSLAISEGIFLDSNGGFNPTSINESNIDSSGGEGYDEYDENDFILTSDEAVSTFSIDADGASYANVRRFLNSGELPPQGAIRTEELINYFEMDYEHPTGSDLMKMNAEVSVCPWKSSNYLMRIGARGKDIPASQLPNSNFVFLIDVSGSMNRPDKIELLKESFIEFVEFLPANDRIAIVTYSGSSNVILNSTPVSQASTIISAIQSLQTGGGTNGAEGIITAYEIAEANFIEGGNNRLIVGTDGDFNIGVSSSEGLVELIEEKREGGVFLSVLGFGTGNLQDGKMESISNNGNGTYEYIDATPQAIKVFIDEYKKFYAAAKDVKMQITFNENTVSAYRLIGYENRLLATEDFEDDTKDAGELGINQTITALYEIVPAAGGSIFTDLGVIDYRYKQVDADISEEFTLEIPNNITTFNNSSENMRFTAAVAGYGMLLWGSEYTGNMNFNDVKLWAQGASSYDPGNWREEFIELVEIAQDLQ
jgi:Ca-activated chloride channel family protein